MRNGAVARTLAARLCLVSDKVLPVSTGEVPEEAPGRVTGTELTGMSSSMGRRLDGGKRRCSGVARGLR
jgi:hypothetical protein